MKYIIKQYDKNGVLEEIYRGYKTKEDAIEDVEFLKRIDSKEPEEVFDYEIEEEQ